MVYRYDTTSLSGKISDYEDELLLHKVDETKWEKHWNNLVQKRHYLGFEGSFGGRVKYIITLAVIPNFFLTTPKHQVRLDTQTSYA